jgi:hypothetical protein
MVDMSRSRLIDIHIDKLINQYFFPKYSTIPNTACEIIEDISDIVVILSRGAMRDMKDIEMAEILLVLFC